MVQWLRDSRQLHLNAEEKPENPDYPKEFERQDFKALFDPRGVLDCKATAYLLLLIHQMLEKENRNTKIPSLARRVR